MNRFDGVEAAFSYLQKKQKKEDNLEFFKGFFTALPISLFLWFLILWALGVFR